ncbi:MAG: hypothetical protein ONB48_17955 [candidate division KSB1 bacterium]|nr:hypothetical protein [candidate division KSB1 bacterium]MDZ7275775.1 hypothetical protein [candidate division KSB1 bacterium]MDZ7287528.1 hypothetical protein [candidate division KSB1 bacterium]MDZ7309140.1 hypothetical protein [candidate division KSB1 bacterium]MDZ7350506.1 hypothetical protein [candidate division KSB1 bacterium]
MHSPILYLPIFTTLIALAFSRSVWQRYRQKGKGAHLLWWAAGILLYGVGTFTEGFTTLFGWHEGIFRMWYISGALLGGAPLAQGTVYLLLRRETANRLTLVLVPLLMLAAACVLAAPVNPALVEPQRLSGKVLEWQWVRLFSPVINSYAFIFLVGGALLSAYRFRKSRQTYHRFIGNIWIAVGALLPGIGGAFTRFGHTEVLYVTELIGIILIFIGYRYNVSGRDPQPALRAAAVPPACQQ